MGGSPAQAASPYPPCALRWPRACWELGALSWPHYRPGRGSHEGDGRKRSVRPPRCWCNPTDPQFSAGATVTGRPGASLLRWGLWCCLAGHPEDKLGSPQTEPVRSCVPRIPVTQLPAPPLTTCPQRVGLQQVSKSQVWVGPPRPSEEGLRLTGRGQPLTPCSLPSLEPATSSGYLLKAPGPSGCVAAGASGKA